MVDWSIWIIAIVLIALFGFNSATAKAKSSKTSYDENYFNVRIAKDLGGKAEVNIKHNRRADILTWNYAYETDWSHKAWSEGVGQALAYAMLTGKKPGIIVLVDKAKGYNRDHKAILKKLAKKYGIAVIVYECNKRNGKYRKISF